MLPFGIGEKSKMNLHDSNKCYCSICNSIGRMMSNKNKRTKLKRELRNFLKM